MRRLSPLLIAAITACSPDSAPDGPVLKAGTYFGAGRDALCIIGDKSPQRAAFIAFAAKGDANCAAEGTVVSDGGRWAIVPKGEGPCRIPLTRQGDGLAIGPVPASCAYYCGPGAALGGQRFQWKDTRDLLLKDEPLAHDGVC